MTPSTKPARDEAVTTAMVNAAFNEAKTRRMTGLPNDFRAVLEAALASAPAPASGVDAVRERAAQICEEARSVRGHIIEYDGMSFVKIDDVNAELNRRAAEIRSLSPAATSGSEAGGEDWVERKAAREKREAEIMQEYAWGNLTPLGVANHLKRAGFNIDYAVKVSNALAKPASSPAGGDVREAVAEYGMKALPEDVCLRMEREARNLANLWANGDEPVRHAALALQVRTHVTALSPSTSAGRVGE